jgi:predicted transposase/invertase (TIGR01784 family)
VTKQKIEEAIGALKRGHLSEEEIATYYRFMYERRVAERVRYEQILIGYEKGLELGREEGKKELKIEIARKLLLKFDVQEVAHITGLSSDEIKQLK